jgi:hypothetical protein
MVRTACRRFVLPTPPSSNQYLDRGSDLYRQGDATGIMPFNNAAERETRPIVMTESFYTSSSSICKH